MRHLASKLPNLYGRLPLAAARGQSLQTQSGTQGEHIFLVQQAFYSATFSCLSTAAQLLYLQAGPNTSRLAPHLQQEWDHAGGAHLGRTTTTPKSERKVWWKSGVCKTGQPHRWQATVGNR